MGLVCVHCALKALVENRTPELFDEEPAEHMKRLHSDVDAMLLERKELERQLAERND